VAFWNLQLSQGSADLATHPIESFIISISYMRPAPKHET